MSWGLGGWLLTPFLMKIGAADAAKLRARVAAELKTTFASHYAKEVTLAQALSAEAIAVYGQRSTGTPDQHFAIPGRRNTARQTFE